MEQGSNQAKAGESFLLPTRLGACRPHESACGVGRV
jgi:hypothetical protein